MYITINDVIGEKTIDLSYPIHSNTGWGKEIAVVSMHVHVPIFGRLSGSEDRGGGDNSIQFSNIGRMGDKSFKELR